LEELLEVRFAVILSGKSSKVSRAENTLAEFTGEALALVVHKPIHCKFFHGVHGLAACGAFWGASERHDC
tara:strand:+ start:1248 stop:1457 length:210 start_codon:yes stop_codon:yes gene_type:complete